jgi:hypothetical protein
VAVTAVKGPCESIDKSLPVGTITEIKKQEVRITSQSRHQVRKGLSVTREARWKRSTHGCSIAVGQGTNLVIQASQEGPEQGFSPQATGLKTGDVLQQRPLEKSAGWIDVSNVIP